MAKVVKIEEEAIEFDNGYRLYSVHERDCCESHYLWFKDLSLEDFDGLEFDLNKDDFFRRIEEYGIELIPINNFGVKVPGYYTNNGYYSHNLSLEISDKDGNVLKTYDIEECQLRIG